MRRRPGAGWLRRVALALAVVALAGCETAELAFPRTVGPDPVLPPPEGGLVPTVDIAPAIGWPDGATPTAAEGLAVNAFAGGLDHPRWLYVLPNGDVLVAETNAPPKEDGGGLKAWFMKLVMKHAGAAVPSADRITLLRDGDGDGVADHRSVLLDDLHSPFGMALVGDTLYIANADALVSVPYRPGQLRIEATPTVVAPLPGGPINHHWTKSLLASRDGSRLYVGVGSNSNVGESGMDAEVDRATILQVDPATGDARVFASGLRNPVGLDWQPATGALWAVVNERDELGSDLVPDYLTSIREGGFYGWPYSYWGQHADARVQPPRPDLVTSAIAPDYALGNHVAPLGLAFYDAALMPRFSGGALIGEHGSWNRRPPSGYKVVFVPFDDGMPSGPPSDVLTGFVGEDGNARGRPVGVAVAADGALLVADDVGNVVWRVAPDAGSAAR
ncbi:sorbosone dehydrogenase family protein [Lysobacter erysipheiresistens]|uniref:Sorbosone dehydrogenase family protein n=1 Tax=Novilysobacter erysipheiresistens TaxID=1749332 RepID=A0ABU7YY81_9GAMM